MQYEAVWRELRDGVDARRSAVAGEAKQRQPTEAGSPATAGPADNVVPHPARHHSRPNQVDGAQAAAGLQSGELNWAQALAALRRSQVEEAQAPGTVEWMSLHPLVKEAIASATATHDWYDRRASHVKNLSRLSRLFAIWLAVLGGLCPLLPDSMFAPFLDYFSASGATATGSGLVFFVIAGGFMLLDQAFGFSSSWMRYRLAALRLGKLIRTFAVDVESELAKCGGKRLPAEQVESILARLKAFVTEVENRKIEETETWVAEFKAGLLQIEQITKGRGKSGAGQTSGQ
jgi:hypothetical protein